MGAYLVTEELIQLLESGTDAGTRFAARIPACHAQRALLRRPPQWASGVDLHRPPTELPIFQRANLRAHPRKGNHRRPTSRLLPSVARIDGADLFSADLSGADLARCSPACTFLPARPPGGPDLTPHWDRASQIAMRSVDLATRLPRQSSRPASWVTGLRLMTPRGSDSRAVIGGCGALTAAFETHAPRTHRRYEVTVYQMDGGWAAKGAQGVRGRAY